MSVKIKSALSMLVAVMTLMLSSVVALAAEQDIVTNQDSMNEIIAEINSEYGTNIHILSKEPSIQNIFYKFRVKQ